MVVVSKGQNGGFSLVSLRKKRVPTPTQHTAISYTSPNLRLQAPEVVAQIHVVRPRSMRQIQAFMTDACTVRQQVCLWNFNSGCFFCVVFLCFSIFVAAYLDTARHIRSASTCSGSCRAANPSVSKASHACESSACSESASWHVSTSPLSCFKGEIDVEPDGGSL